MAEEAKQPTQNDIAEMTELFKGALRTATSTPIGAGLNTGSQEIFELIDKLSSKVPSLENMIIPPFISTFMLQSMGPVLERGRALGDKYVPKIEEELKSGRYNRLADLLKLSTLNQMRLQYGQDTAFSVLRDGIVKKYHSDIVDKQGTIGFVPAKTEETKTLWYIVESLSEKGLVTVLENDISLSKQYEGIKVAIIRMAENV